MSPEPAAADGPGPAPADGPGIEAARRAILAAVLKRVAVDGWTWSTVEAAAAAAGTPPATAMRAFPRGVRDVLALFAAESDRRMVAALARRDLAALAVRERIALAVRLRLEQAADHREAVRHALALRMTPAHAGALPGEVARTVDAMWRAAGDTATDFNYYTKRALLAGVYGATLLHWLDDRSPGFADSWAFLDRRVADVMRIQKARGRLDRTLARLARPLAAALARQGPRAVRDWSG